jgi:hypothetical protein
LGSFMIAKPPPPRKRKLMTGCYTSQRDHI